MVGPNMSHPNGHQMIASAIENCRDMARTPIAKKLALAAAALAFSFGGWIALATIDLELGDVVWWPIILVAILGVAGTQTLNAVEMELSAKSLHHSFGFASALELSILGSAANMLPLPGAAMVRMGALRSVGARLRDSGAVTLAIALIWAGIAFLLSGTALAGSAPLLAPAFLLLGLVTAIGAIFWLRKLGSTWPTVLLLILVKIGLVVLSVFRIQLCLIAIGTSASFEQVTIFAVSALLGSAVSIVPAGLGIRELASAALAPFVGIEASVAFIATALDRIIEMPVLLLLSLGLSLSRRRHQ